MHHDRLYAFARCVALDITDGAVPDWIELLPPGPIIKGRDGRRWLLPDPQPVIDAFAQLGRPLVVDWEHATETRAPQGLDAPASGWIDQIEIRSGGPIWGRVAWTPRAIDQIAAREYRYISPVIQYQRDTLEIVAITSAALTNTPNLTLTALNQQGTPMNDDLLERLRYLLNLPTLATVEEVIAELDKLRTQLAAAPTDTAGNRLSLSALLATAINRTEVQPLEKFVPRADYDATLARAVNAEQKLAAIETAQRDAEIAGLVESALQAGKITPATKDYYLAMCRSTGGVEAFKAFVEKATPVVGSDPPLAGKPPQSTGTLTETQRAICRAMNIPLADYAKHLTKEAA